VYFQISVQLLKFLKDIFCYTFVKVETAIQEKCPRKKVLFHNDNAPVHSSAVAQQKITEWRFELLAHPPYSPNLGPSDFHLFPKLKKKFSWKEISVE
jgi:histone-lysine N-methyltransferase SETMAR